MISGPSNHHPHLIPVSELLQPGKLCCAPGPGHAKCLRGTYHPQPCATLITDTEGRPVVMTWYRPDTDTWPLTDRDHTPAQTKLVDHGPRQCGDPGA